MRQRDPSNANRDPEQIAIQVRDSGVGIDRFPVLSSGWETLK